MGRVLHGRTGTVNGSGVANASEGCSIDILTGDVVLGQDAGDPGNPAILTKDREIPMTGNFNLFLLGMLTASGQEFTLLNGNTIAIFADPLTGNAASLALNQNSTSGQFNFSRENGYGSIAGAAGNLQMNFFDVPRVAVLSEFGLVNPIVTSCTLNVDGGIFSLTGVIAPRTVNVQPNNYAVIGPDDNNTLITNTGAAGLGDRVLPAIATIGVGVGFTLIITVTDVLGVQILASGGNVITIAGTAVIGAASATSVMVGSTIRLTATTATDWFAESFTGTWI